MSLCELVILCTSDFVSLCVGELARRWDRAPMGLCVDELMSLCHELKFHVLLLSWIDHNSYALANIDRNLKQIRIHTLKSTMIQMIIMNLRSLISFCEPK